MLSPLRSSPRYLLGVLSTSRQFGPKSVRPDRNQQSKKLVVANLSTSSVRSATVMASVKHGGVTELLADKLEKPELDNRSYRVIRLPNKLEGLLVHDPDTDKASASVNVGVGSFSDDDDMPGMAHAVEHLLFMGPKKVCC